MSTQQEQKQAAVVVAVVAKPAAEQEQKQGVPPDPVQEQRQSYTPPENAIANDPITEVTTVAQAMEEAAKEQPKAEQKKE